MSPSSSDSPSGGVRPSPGSGAPARSRRERGLRFAYDLSRYCTRKLIQDRAPQMAAALTYRTIFSLIPLLVLSLVVLRAFYGDDGIRQGLDRVLDFTGLNEIALDEAKEAATREAQSQLTPIVGPPAPSSWGTSAEPPTSNAISDWIEHFVNNAVTRVSGINYGAITVVGVAILIYAALSLLIQVEQAFNHICRATHGRKLLARLTTYWTLLTLGGLGLFASFSLAEGYRQILDDWPTWAEWASRPFQFVIRVGITWLMLIFAYTRVPTIKVRLRPAAAGAAVAAVMWELCKSGLSWFIRELTSSQIAIYGSLALVPLALFWIYVTWLIILFGLELGQTLQNVAVERLRERRENQRSPLVDPARATIAVRALARAFDNGKSLETEAIARAAGMDFKTTRVVVDHLVRRGFVNHVYDQSENDSDGEAFALARPAVGIDLADLTSALFELAGAQDGDPDDPALDRLRRAQLDALRGRTLAQLDE